MVLEKFLLAASKVPIEKKYEMLRCQINFAEFFHLKNWTPRKPTTWLKCELVHTCIKIFCLVSQTGEAEDMLEIFSGVSNRKIKT